MSKATEISVALASAQWLVLALKSAVSGWGWKITWREPNHRPGLYQPCPSTPTLTKAPFQQVCRTMAPLKALLFDPTLPGFPWDKRGKMTVWWLHKSILSAGCCWGAGQRVELSAMLSLKNCAGMRLCRQSWWHRHRAVGTPSPALFLDLPESCHQPVTSCHTVKVPSLFHAETTWAL